MALGTEQVVPLFVDVIPDTIDMCRVPAYDHSSVLHGNLAVFGRCDVCAHVGVLGTREPRTQALGRR